MALSFEESKKKLFEQTATPMTMSMARGVVAAATQSLLLPAESKAAIKSTLFGKDHFLKKTYNCAVKTLNKTNLPIDPELAVKNANDLYPSIKKVAKSSIGKIAKVGAVVAGAILIGRTIGDVLVKKMNAKKEG